MPDLWKPAPGRYHILIHKSRSTWYWTCANPQGGSFGSNYCGPKKIALLQATRSIPHGERYLITDDTDEANPKTIEETKP